MMGSEGMTVLLAVYWVTGVVGAASLPTDDQYSPYQSPHRRDFAQGPPSYSNWLKHQEDLTARLEPPEYIPQSRKSNYPLRDRGTRKGSPARDTDTFPWILKNKSNTDSIEVKKQSSGSKIGYFDVLDDAENNSAAKDDDFARDETFQDQGPGSLEIYKLDLHHENSLLVPNISENQGIVESSKDRKKVPVEENFWSLKSTKIGKTPLPLMFQQPTNIRNNSINTQKYGYKSTSQNDEAFAVGGVPELQVGCEGLEASGREKRSEDSYAKKTRADYWDDTQKYQDPVYKESTEPILMRMTPIVLDIDEEQPEAGKHYEEMDELLKLKKQESTSQNPPTEQRNRADIEPRFDINESQEEGEFFPQRGDLGRENEKDAESDDSTKEAIAVSADHQRDNSKKETFQKDDFLPIFPPSSAPSNDDSKLNVRLGRNVRSSQYPTMYRNPNGKPMQHSASYDRQEKLDSWGFGEREGAIPDDENEDDTKDVGRTQKNDFQRKSKIRGEDTPPSSSIRKQVPERGQKSEESENQRNQHERDYDERRKQLMEENRRFDTERRNNYPERRVTEEEIRERDLRKKLEDYIRRNTPIIVSKNSAKPSNDSPQKSDGDSQRQTLEAARQWQNNYRPMTRNKYDRNRGPSAPANYVQARSQIDSGSPLEHEQLANQRQRQSDRQRMEEEAERDRQATHRRDEMVRRQEEARKLMAERQLLEERRLREEERMRNERRLEEDRKLEEERKLSKRRKMDEGNGAEVRKGEETDRPRDAISGNPRIDWYKIIEDEFKRKKELIASEWQKIKDERNHRYDGYQSPNVDDNRCVGICSLLMQPSYEAIRV